MAQPTLESLRQAINSAWLCDETDAVHRLLGSLGNYDPDLTRRTAEKLVSAIRTAKPKQSITEAFLHEYQLNSTEGIVLMSIAEALLRIPDQRTQDQFLAEKLAAANWRDHLHHSDSWLVNLSTDALLLTGQFEKHLKPSYEQHQFHLNSLLARLGMPLIRKAVKQSMQLLGSQFVMAEAMGPALRKSSQQSDYRYSFDMLGEAAITAADAERYYQAYLFAIQQAGQSPQTVNLFDKPGVSIKLSALCPRFESLQRNRAVTELTGKLIYLAQCAKTNGISVTVDAEESDRLEMTLDIFAAALTHPSLSDWQGLGLAVQAYQKRAIHVLAWLDALASLHHCKIPVRLVKGAYWDSEIKRAQENGLSHYPVFTRKSATDISYLACANFLLTHPDTFYPQFATHNAHTVAAIYHLGETHPAFEFQRLHGMGDTLYHELIVSESWQIPCRIYAPVGNYQELLPYLVRRLLENGANTSFINQVENPDFAIETLTRDPVAFWRAIEESKKSGVSLPCALFLPARLNSAGFNLADPLFLDKIQHYLDSRKHKIYYAHPVVNGQTFSGDDNPVYAPFDHDLQLGRAVFSRADAVEQALESAYRHRDIWRLTPVNKRVAAVNKAADLLEANAFELMALCVYEGGKTIKDALAEIREAVDFCRYYAQQATLQFGQPINLPGPTGEQNTLRYTGRGVFVCISPWNFPVAIFMGQIAAALVAGNTVIAKPAEQTSLAAFLCIRLLYEAGIPEPVLHFLPGSGAEIGEQLLSDYRIAGVAFTGSTKTARHIARKLLEVPAIVPLIAETGGQNALIADSSAHKEQLVQDVIYSAFNSAGQRCSALRVLFLPEAIAERVIELIIGSMNQLVLGNPAQLDTDIGPVIDSRAKDRLYAHLAEIKQQGKLLHQLHLSDELSRQGHFFPPALVELQSMGLLKHEVFGPILHVVRYQTDQLDQVIAAINASGYGLTLGIHSRLNDTLQTIAQHAKVGNVYVNRNMIGAVVGSQPFGGMEQSGTGPKAGGPDYLKRFACEQTLCINTAAVGGNTSLLSQDLS
jgi:RHH-type transcriptional regulator, proline utilization regulon repressor / proline dehydrogenase / delta 1-pyrroline-5-carboxylate dehydrogenase